MKGLLVSVLRDAQYHGRPQQATENFNGFVLTGSGMPEIFTPNEHHPELRLVRGNLPGTWKTIPADIPDGIWSMFGGHYVTTSDSRLGEIVGHPAVVPVHDRVER